MTRVLLAITGTIAGLVALLSFKSHSMATSAHGLPSASLPSSSATSPVAPGSQTSTATAAMPHPTASSTPSAASAQRTLDGQAVVTRYGTVQVRVVVSGKSIKNVSFLQLTADDAHSQAINDQAGPMLLQETLQAQSSNIDTISGATFTSEGYVQSLQSALDQAGLK